MTTPEPSGTDRFKALQLLREPFPAENIAKLPKVNCGNCTQAARAKRGDTCDRHSMSKCKECDAWITSGHIHLDYVGHAEATDRLLDADLEWTWEPLATTPEGLPLFDQLGGLWIRMTVAGVTRIGYGSANGKTGPDAIKEVIGDAIRNSGMRFGLALNLWAKTDLHADEQQQAEEDTPTTVTDPAWLAQVRQRIGGAADVDELNVVGQDIAAQHDDGHLANADGTALRQLFDGRRAELMRPERPMTRQTQSGPEDDQWTTPPPASDGPTPNPSTEPMITPAQSRAMHAVFSTGRVASRERRLEIAGRIVGRGLGSTAELTRAEASAVIDALNAGEIDRLATPAGPSTEGISVTDALMQIITEAHDEDTFETARAEIQREHETGGIDAQQLAALRARWTAARNASMAGATS